MPRMQDAQKLLEQTTYESAEKTAVTSRPYSTGRAAIWAFGRQAIQCTAIQTASGIIWAKMKICLQLLSSAKFYPVQENALQSCSRRKGT